VEESFSLGRDLIGCRQSTTTCETFREKVVPIQFTGANTEIVAGANLLLDTTNLANDSEMKQWAEDRNLHRYTKVHDILEMWQCSQKPPVTQEESHTQYKQMTAVGYISDKDVIFKAPWSLFQHDGVTALVSSERSLLPPPSSAKDLLEDELKY